MFRKLCQYTVKIRIQQQPCLRVNCTRNVAFASSTAANTETGELLMVRSTPKISNKTIFCRSMHSSGECIAIVPYEYIKELPKHADKLLIDVREPAELQNTGQIPTSINIPLGSLTQELSTAADPSEFAKKYSRQKPSEQTEIIFSCQSGKRSTQASEIALSLGYKNIKNYVGSWLDWAAHEGIKT